jgi:hypothetical protein
MPSPKREGGFPFGPIEGMGGLWRRSPIPVKSRKRIRSDTSTVREGEEGFISPPD